MYAIELYNAGIFAVRRAAEARMWEWGGCQMTLNVCFVGLFLFAVGWLREKILRLRLQKELKQLKATTNEQTSR